MKKILSIILCLSLILGLAVAASADETLNVVADGSNTADFSALVDSTGEINDNSYADRTSGDGWSATGALNTDMADGVTAIVLNGKTSAPGKLTSGTLTGPLSSVSFNYGFPFSDSQFSITISVLQGGNVVASTTVEETGLEKNTAYSHVWNLDAPVEGEYTLEIVNNCLSGSSKNKERLAIWNLTWSSEASTPVVPTPDPEPDPEPAVPETEAEIVDAAFKLADGEKLPYEATLTGKIVEIVSAYHETYKNITVNIEVVNTAGETKVLQCFRMKGEGVADLAVDDTITVTGEILNYGGTFEFNSGCVCSNIVKGESEEIVVPTDPKEIVDAAFKLAEGEYLPYDATLTGKIVEIVDAYHETYKNITVKIEVVNTANETIELLCFRIKGDKAAELEVGDTITVTGKIKNHYGTVEFDAGSVVTNVVKNDVVQTGDSISVFVALMAVSAVGAAVLLKKKF